MVDNEMEESPAHWDETGLSLKSLHLALLPMAPQR